MSNVKTAEAPKEDTIELLMLRGYVPENAQAVTFEPNGKPATLEKAKKGTVVHLPVDEGRRLIRRGSAVRPDEATDNQLIQAGLMHAPEPKDEDTD